MKASLQRVFDWATANLEELDFGEVNVKLVVHQGQVTKTVYGVTRNVQVITDVKRGPRPVVSEVDAGAGNGSFDEQETAIGRKE